MSTDLEEFRRRFAAMSELLSGLPDEPSTPEDLAKLGEVRRFMNDERATPSALLGLPAADLNYLRGLSIEQIGELLNVTGQAVSTNLIGPYGPAEYVAVRRVGDGPTEMQRVPVAASDRTGATRRRLRQLRDEGWRVAPATWRVDPDVVNPAELWDRLGEAGAR